MAVASSNAFAQGNVTFIPDVFQNEKDAIEHSCAIVRLKDANHPMCVLQEFEVHKLRLNIYDANVNGKFEKSEELCIPSWYQKAKVEFIELSSKGQQFIFVRFEGNTGTGTLQTILMIIGWHHGKFIPVLAETIDYYIKERDDITSLKMSYAIENIRTQGVSLLLNYKFVATDRNEFPSQFSASWTESLKWDEESFSFYNEQAEREKIKRTLFLIQKNISNVRLLMRDVDTTKLCIDFFKKTKIMYILEGYKEEKGDGSIY
jgi:hypothetical protein